MAISWRVAGGAALITLEGQLSHADHAEFRRITTEAAAHDEVEEFILDFGAVSYLDSAGMGMLLLLKHRADQRRVRFINCLHGVRSVLKIARFDTLFEVS